MVKAALDELSQAQRPEPVRGRNSFTLGIEDDVSFSSLAVEKDFTIETDKTTRAVFYGLGADGTVGANKNSVKIIAEDAEAICAGLLRLRFPQIRRADDFASAIWARPDQGALSDRLGRFRCLSSVRISRTAGPAAGRRRRWRVPSQQPLSGRTRPGTNCQSPCSNRSSTRNCASLSSTPPPWPGTSVSACAPTPFFRPASSRYPACCRARRQSGISRKRSAKPTAARAKPWWRRISPRSMPHWPGCSRSRCRRPPPIRRICRRSSPPALPISSSV